MGEASIGPASRSRQSSPPGPDIIINNMEQLGHQPIAASTPPALGEAIREKLRAIVISHA